MHVHLADEPNSPCKDPLTRILEPRNVGTVWLIYRTRAHQCNQRDIAGESYTVKRSYRTPLYSTNATRQQLGEPFAIVLRTRIPASTQGMHMLPVAIVMCTYLLGPVTLRCPGLCYDGMPRMFRLRITTVNRLIYAFRY